MGTIRVRVEDDTQTFGPTTDDLDGDCTLPTRDEELRYLRDLAAREDALARLYSPLHAIADYRPENRIGRLISP